MEDQGQGGMVLSDEAGQAAASDSGNDTSQAPEQAMISVSFDTRVPAACRERIEAFIRKELKTLEPLLENETPAETTGSIQYFDGFCLDTVPSLPTTASETKQFTKTWARPLEVGDSAMTKEESFGGCFNCGVPDHQLSDCPYSLDQERINRRRAEFRAKQPDHAGRYHAGSSGQQYMPGKIGPAVREALGISDNELPPYINKMKSLGYPPAWTKEVYHTYCANLNGGFALGFTDDPEETRRALMAKRQVPIDPQPVKYAGFNSPWPKPKPKGNGTHDVSVVDMEVDNSQDENTPILLKGEGNQAQTWMDAEDDFFEAVAASKTAAVNTFLARFPQLVHARTRKSWSGLHLACDRGHYLVAASIIKAGANVDLQTVTGDRPLHLAARHGHHLLVKLLLNSNADPLLKNTSDELPLDIAKNISEPLFQMLKEATDIRVASAGLVTAGAADG